MMRERIESGEWPPDRRIPSAISLEHEYGVARATVHKAIKYLRDLGLLRTIPNWGSVVQAGANHITRVTLKPGGRVIGREATTLEQERLGLPEGATVIVVESPDGAVEVYPAYTVEIRAHDA